MAFQSGALPRRRRLGWVGYASIVGATILVATELVIAAIATSWALAGLFHLGGIFGVDDAIVMYVLGVILLGGSVYVTWRFVQAAIATEPGETAD